MKQKFEIEHGGEIKQLGIEPVVYQDKHMYEVAINDRYFVLYQEGNTWRQEADEKLDEELFNRIVDTIEANGKKLQTY